MDKMTHIEPFAGTLGDQYRQIGNAVPVKSARRVGVEIVRALYGRDGDADTSERASGVDASVGA